MDRIKRNERLGAMTHLLIQTPNKIHTFSEFCEMFGSAKSTISEDINLIADSLSRFGLGTVYTISGASGGVIYQPSLSLDKVKDTLTSISKTLSDPDRILPGGFLYTSDITSDPATCEILGRIFAMRFWQHSPSFVITMETKGIPLALMTARALNIPLVIARRDSKAYEGSAVKISYISGGESGHIETMALSRRAVKAGQRALIIDDFTKGGGTLQGMVDMMAEFQSPVVGIGVMISTAVPSEKRCRDVKALFTLDAIDAANAKCVVSPSEEFIHAIE
ncbi:MAG: pur operon repressor [Clostridia bacterium]|nr:pur operon repressor [Clostridia bacterium]MBQ9857331.1 pur operon repressor [Clostridia bacterium]